MERKVEKVRFALPLQRMLKRVAAYARVSSGKDAMLHSLSAQVSYYSSYIQSRPGWSYVGVYSDEALTGTKDDRSGFQTLLKDCRAGKIDIVITKSISRFARNTVTLLETVRELKTLGIDVFFEEQNIHTLSSEGELMLTILASYAQEESLSVSENCKWYWKQRMKEGCLHEPFKGIVFAARGDAVSLLLASITLTAKCGMAMSAHAVPFLYGRLPASFARQVDRAGRQMLKSTKIR